MVGNISPKNGSMIYWIILQALVKQFEQVFVWYVCVCARALLLRHECRTLIAFHSCFHRFVSPTNTPNAPTNIAGVRSVWPLKYGMFLKSRDVPVSRDVCKLLNEPNGKNGTHKHKSIQKKHTQTLDFNSHQGKHNVPVRCIDCVFSAHWWWGRSNKTRARSALNTLIYVFIRLHAKMLVYFLLNW